MHQHSSLRFPSNSVPGWDFLCKLSHIAMDEIINIQDFIHIIRGHRVMLDRDIAAFYGVETKRLNEKVKRNPKRFAGEDFMFQLTKEELDELLSRSQIATLKKRRPIGFIQPKEEDNQDD